MVRGKIQEVDRGPLPGWHAQTLNWVFAESRGTAVSREVLLQRMHDHIRTVVGRHKGRIAGWDVVNEALNKDGTLRESPWKRIIGKEYIAEAFRFAHEADPAAELYYNDYDLEIPAKRQGVVALLKKLQAQGIPVKRWACKTTCGWRGPALPKK
jgi:endo-1,4-beta-xylanase